MSGGWWVGGVVWCWGDGLKPQKQTPVQRQAGKAPADCQLTIVGKGEIPGWSGLSC